jgi:hypothetical protein
MDAQLIDSSFNNENIREAAVKAIKESVAVSEKYGQLDAWAVAKSNLGALAAQRSRSADCPDEERAFHRVRAIAEYLSALEAFEFIFFPYKVAETQVALADVYIDQAERVLGTAKEVYLFRAVQMCEAAAGHYDPQHYPKHWAKTQMYLGLIFLLHSEIEGINCAVEDLNRALIFFQNAREIFEQVDAQPQLDACRARICEVETALKQAQAPP